MAYALDIFELKLVEMSLAAITLNTSRFRRISKQRAHDWVRAGQAHETPLYVEGDKIKRRRHYDETSS
jgi:hypothetical protein